VSEGKDIFIVFDYGGDVMNISIGKLRGSSHWLTLGAARIEVIDMGSSGRTKR